MSEFGDIEDAVVGLLTGLQDSGSDVFATVRGYASADRKSALSAIERWLFPAALISVDARPKVAGRESLPGAPRLTLMLAARGLRSAGASRRGDVDTRGAVSLAALTTVALDSAMLLGVWRLRCLDEQIVAANDRQVVIEQRYAVERPAEVADPTFGGNVITGGEASVSVEVEPVEAAHISFAFAGVDGAFRHALGAKPREIRWRGQLRADTHAELNATEAAIEALVGAGQTATVADAVGRTFGNCVADAFTRRGSRQVHPATGRAAQDFELVFVQLAE